ncbi:FHA domain-containing protein [Microbacterium sp. ru370.1]|uniref:FHA domain-containing protein n=1 Tax=unclassified Microbacterium TaxID=2609290 RepID=UPI00089221B2|nr:MULTISPECIES: FHA domain-containing protein [unclassified Microbacterium]SDO39934.1 FHA domain-containing protein [Microbacterium sp. ru370.1]SIT79489.1 FHA domain-containing protein [Microbacterium sp. RU1D]
MDALSLIATIAGAVLVIALVLHVWYAIGLSRVIAVHGGEPWRAWVPLVNEAEVFRLGRLDPVRAVLLAVPFVNVYALVLKARAAHRLGESSGRGAGTTALAVVLPPAWAMLLARTPQTDAEPSASGQITVAETTTTDDAVAPIAAVPGTSADAAPPAAAAGGRRTAPEHDEPYAVPVLPGPREIGADAPTVEPAAAADLDGAVAVTASPATAGRMAAAPSKAVPMADAPAAVPASDALVTRVPDAALTRSADVTTAQAETTAAKIDDRTDGRGDDRVSETTDSTAERSAGRTDGAAPLDESTQTARPRSRRRGEWTLGLPGGAAAALTGRTVVLGRKPSHADDAVQYVAVHDDTRTMSKEHARLDWTVTGWTITDLQSTNGVTLVHDDGRVERLPSGGTSPVPSRFRLGDADLELRPTAG